MQAAWRGDVRKVETGKRSGAKGPNWWGATAREQTRSNWRRRHVKGTGEVNRRAQVGRFELGRFCGTLPLFSRSDSDASPARQRVGRVAQGSIGQDVLRCNVNKLLTEPNTAKAPRGHPQKAKRTTDEKTI